MIFSNDYADQLDLADSLASFRDRFHIPKHTNGDQIYLCGNSLGLQPKSVKSVLQQELDDWAALGVEGHFHAKHPWMPYHSELRDLLAENVGAKPVEVVAMNSLTVNLHLLMVSFYRPNAERPAIIIEQGAFPSDRYAVESQIRFHGFDPSDCLIEISADPDSGLIPTNALENCLREHGHRVALILWPGVQYRTGQAFDLKAIADLGHFYGCQVGFDLAHAAGNLPLQLHDSGADFAAWCSYKYLNSGPGNVSGIFVHERYADRPDLHRFAGWWGHSEAERFKMEKGFQPMHGADGWQLACSNVLSLAVHQASLDLFQEAGMPAIREKSIQLTGYLEYLIEEISGDSGVLEIITPKNPAERGCQLSLLIHKGGKAVFDEWYGQGVVGDWRNPNVIRLAPAPLYTSFEDVYRFARVLEQSLKKFA